MRLLKRMAAVGAVAMIALPLAACAKNGAAASGGGGLVVGSKSVSSLGSVLVSPKGLTLYHMTPESASKIVCTGQCTSIWPPLLVPSGESGASAGSGVSGSFGTIQRPGGGVQVTFDGMPLYTYSGDSSPGQANGQGIQGIWFAVSASGGSAGGSSSGGKGGYGSGGY
jgi:predicted lipoprotein with Yx(FWY)xxD motif